MEQRISLITLGVRDLAAARRFYEAGLGFRRNNSEEEVAFYQLPGFVLALWDRAELAADALLADSPPGFSGVALAYNTRSRAEVDEVLNQAREAGGTPQKPAAATPWGGYSGYFLDPDGHLWEVAHNPEWTIDDNGAIIMS